MEALTLSGTGLAVALIMGFLFVIFGGHLWWFFILGMMLFLVLSAMVTWIGKGYKSKKKLGQDPRGIRNVVANGLMPLVIAGLYYLMMAIGKGDYASIFLFGFICSVAAITADKFASEIGVLGPMPISLISGKRVRKGVSGGVTWLGLTVSALAPLLIGLILIPLALTTYSLGIGAYLAIAIVTLCGFLGSLVDSFLGYYEEKGIGNKFTSNFLCSIAGAAVGIILIVLF
jgi:uncharacterized protein (TIGR00297 family)